MPEHPPPPPPSRGPNCWQCQHFAVSWDPRRPYACQRMGFKSPALPALEVLRIDGLPCRGFVPKPASPASGAQDRAQPRNVTAPLAAPTGTQGGWLA